MSKLPIISSAQMAQILRHLGFSLIPVFAGFGLNRPFFYNQKSSRAVID